MSESTALPTEPQPLPQNYPYFVLIQEVLDRAEPYCCRHHAALHRQRHLGGLLRRVLLLRRPELGRRDQEEGLRQGDVG